MAEKIVARIPAAPGTFAVKKSFNEDKTVYVYLERVLYWNLISDAGNRVLSADGTTGTEFLVAGGQEGPYGFADAYLHPDGSVEVPDGETYSSLKAYAAHHNAVIDSFFCDLDCNDVNALFGKDAKDDAICIKIKRDLNID